MDQREYSFGHPTVLESSSEVLDMTASNGLNGRTEGPSFSLLSWFFTVYLNIRDSLPQLNLIQSRGNYYPPYHHRRLFHRGQSSHPPLSTQSIPAISFQTQLIPRLSHSRPSPSPGQEPSGGRVCRLLAAWILTMNPGSERIGSLDLLDFFSTRFDGAERAESGGGGGGHPTRLSRQ